MPPRAVLGHEQPDDARIELRARAGLELGQPLVRRAVLAVRGYPCHRVEALRDRDDARTERDLLALLAEGLAVSVPPLVIGMDHGEDAFPDRDRLWRIRAQCQLLV